MAKRDGIDFIEGLRKPNFEDDLPFDSDISISTTNIVESLHRDDVHTATPKNRTSRIKVYRFVLGDVYRLCRAKNLKEAMDIFGTSDPVRVSIYSYHPQLLLDLFSEPVILTGSDGSTVLEFKFK